ncbi:hypothetical protein D3C80_1795530 [compost metagenome]
MPQPIEARPGTGFHLHRFPHPASHPPADPLVALAHAARLRIALGPAETFGALRIAGQQFLAGIRFAFIAIAGGKVAAAQIHRVDPGRAGQLIHRAFQGDHP